jgi:hypothetical protein
MIRVTHPNRAFTGRNGGIPEICRRPKQYRQYRFGRTQSIRTQGGYIEAAYIS